MSELTRHEWSEAHQRCMVCGWMAKSYRGKSEPRWLETHEICRGPHRQKALLEPAAWIRTCNRCHFDVLDSAPIAYQLAIKKRHDRKHYDRVAVNRLRCRADDAVTEAEVDQYLEGIRGMEESRK